MAGVTVKSLDAADEALEFGEAGRYEISVIGDSMIARSVLNPGWSWDEHIKPYAGGAESCPQHHSEYVISGQIRYLMLDGSEVVAKAGDHVILEPGHRAWVVGDETCVLIDWEKVVPHDHDHDHETG